MPPKQSTGINTGNLFKECSGYIIKNEVENLKRALSSLSLLQKAILLAHATQSGNTLLMTAAVLRKADCLNVIIEECGLNKTQIFEDFLMTQGVKAVAIKTILTLADPKVMELLETKYKNGLTALMYAASTGNTEVVRVILEAAGPKAIDLLNAQAPKGSTALMLAVEKGHTEIVSVILQAAGNNIDNKMMLLNTQSSQGFTALMIAAQKGHTELVSKILEAAGPKAMELLNVKMLDTGLTALMLAAEDGHTEVVRVILEAAGPKAMDLLKAQASDGSTALIYAANNGHTDVVRVILEAAGPKAMDLLNVKASDGSTALIYAAKNGHTDVVSVILEAAGPKAMDLLKAHASDGFTALMLAAHKGHLKVMSKILQAAGSKAMDLLNAKASNRVTALMLAAHKGHLEIIREIQKAAGGYFQSLLTDFINESDCTPFVIAAYYAQQDVFRFICKVSSKQTSQKNIDDLCKCLYIVLHRLESTNNRIFAKEVVDYFLGQIQCDLERFCIYMSTKDPEKMLNGLLCKIYELESVDEFIMSLKANETFEIDYQHSSFEEHAKSPKLLAYAIETNDETLLSNIIKGRLVNATNKSKIKILKIILTAVLNSDNPVLLNVAHKEIDAGILKDIYTIENARAALNENNINSLKWLLQHGSYSEHNLNQLIQLAANTNNTSAYSVLTEAKERAPRSAADLSPRSAADLSPRSAADLSPRSATTHPRELSYLSLEFWNEYSVANSGSKLAFIINCVLAENNEELLNAAYNAVNDGRKNEMLNFTNANTALKQGNQVTLKWILEHQNDFNLENFKTLVRRARELQSDALELILEHSKEHRTDLDGYIAQLNSPTNAQSAAAISPKSAATAASAAAVGSAQNLNKITPIQNGEHPVYAIISPEIEHALGTHIFQKFNTALQNSAGRTRANHGAQGVIMEEGKYILKILGEYGDHRLAVSDAFRKNGKLVLIFGAHYTHKGNGSVKLPSKALTLEESDAKAASHTSIPQLYANYEFEAERHIPEISTSTSTKVPFAAWLGGTGGAASTRSVSPAAAAALTHIGVPVGPAAAAALATTHHLDGKDDEEDDEKKTIPVVGGAAAAAARSLQHTNARWNRE